jgi:hypothetical protein
MKEKNERKGEFGLITRHVVNYFREQGYFTIPLPGKGMKEFRLDLPAFKRFDIVAMKWKEKDDVEIKAVESKLEPKEAILQALIYQLSTPEVYIASNKDIDEELEELLKVCGIGYISVSASNNVCIKLEPKRELVRSRLFPRYHNELLLRSRAILGFYDFMGS